MIICSDEKKGLTYTLTIAHAGPMVQDEALKIADRLEMKQFTASNGWLSRFLARNDIKFKSVDVTPVELLGPFEKGQVEGAKSVANQILNAS